MSEKKSILEKISEGQVWKSIFRGGGVPTTRRQRMMVVLNSVFLHLHPVRLPKHAVKLKFTWCMGGLSFFLFLILTISGILLMLGTSISPGQMTGNLVAFIMPISFAILILIVRKFPENRINLNKYEDSVTILKQYYHVDTILRANGELWMCNEIQIVDYVKIEN